MATEVVHTVGSGGDYPTLEAWEAAQRRDLVSADEIAVAEIIGTVTISAVDYVSISSWTTDSDRYVCIRAQTPYDHATGTGSELSYGAPSATYNFLVWASNHTRVENLKLSGSGLDELFFAGSPEKLIVSGCTIADHDAEAFSWNSNSTGWATFNNCLAINPSNLAVQRAHLNNCTIISPTGGGVFSSSIAVWYSTLKNCAIYNDNSHGSYNTLFSCTEEYCATNPNGTDALTGNGSITTLAKSDFVDYAGNDYSIANDSVLAKAGTNPLTTASDADDWNDITGKTRAYWDIGAFAAPASLAENTHLATFTTRPTDTGSSGGPNVAGTETNYPGYIDLSEAPQALWDAVTSGGGDIRVFENQAGGLVELPAEVVSCDTSAETGELHYLLPSISASTPQEIRLYADGVSSRYDHADPFGRNSVWGDYGAVYHFSDGASATSVADSSGNVDLAVTGTVSEVDSGGLGTALDFGGSAYATADTAAISNFPLTMSAWFRYDEDGFISDVTDSGAPFNRVFMHTTGGKVRLYADGDTNVSSASTLTAGNWYLAHGVAPVGSAEAMYINGSQDMGYSGLTSTRSIAGLDRTDVARLGDSTPGGFGTGPLGELRIRPSDLSAQWIATEYNNQSDPSSFYTATDPSASSPGGDPCMRILLGGQWVKAVPYILDGGTWKIATPYTLTSGVWQAVGETT
jgi:hypothetical protein